MELTRFGPGTDIFDDVWPRLDPRAIRMFEADVVELEDEIEVVAELPGVRMEDLDLTLEANVLTISGERWSGRTSRPASRAES